MNKKIITGILIIIFFTGITGAETLVDKYLSEADKLYITGDYEKAYSHINFVLNFYKEKDLPIEAKITGEKIYYAYITSQIELKTFVLADDYSMKIIEYPEIASLRVKQALNSLEQMEQEVIAAEIAEQARQKELEAEQQKIEEYNKLIEAEKEALRQRELERLAEKAEYDKKLEEYQKLIQQARDAQLEQSMQSSQTLIDERTEYMEELRKIQDDQLEQSTLANDIRSADMLAYTERETAREEAWREERAQYDARTAELIKQRDELATKQQAELARILEASLTGKDDAAASNARTSFYAIILISVIGLFLFAGFGILIFLFLRNSQNEQRRFENTLYAMNTSRPITAINNKVALPDMYEYSEPPPQLEDTTREALPAPQSDEDDFKTMLDKCKNFGVEIDRVTNRKNNSRNIAELIYKISIELGYNNKECMLFFAVGMIYDIGFLNIDPEILGSEKVTEDQYNLIKTHVNLGLNMIYFIDKKYQSVFRDGILMHHENLNGTGYPSGINENEIPYIARVIHAVESFISLISSRGYKEIFDKESAFAELQKEHEKYDSTILNALNNII